MQERGLMYYIQRVKRKERGGNEAEAKT